MEHPGSQDQRLLELSTHIRDEEECNADEKRAKADVSLTIFTHFNRKFQSTNLPRAIPFPYFQTEQRVEPALPNGNLSNRDASMNSPTSNG